MAIVKAIYSETVSPHVKDRKNIMGATRGQVSSDFIFSFPLQQVYLHFIVNQEIFMMLLSGIVAAMAVAKRVGTQILKFSEGKNEALLVNR
jgi:hypothetical protein